jgi:hypothetical protein
MLHQGMLGTGICAGVVKYAAVRRTVFHRDEWAFVSPPDCISHVSAILRHSEYNVLILLIVLILVFGFGGYRMGPGLGYYGGGGLSLILTIVVVLLLLKVI